MTLQHIDLDCSVGRVRLEAPSFPPVGGEAHSVRFVVEADGVSASTTTETFGDGGHRLIDFFDELARDWRGWRDAKRWCSDRAHLFLDATHDGRSAVRMEVYASRPGAYIVDDTIHSPGDWRVHTGVQFDLGALERNAERVRSLLGRSNNPAGS